MFVCVFAHPGRCHKKGGRAFAMGLGIGPILPPNLEIHTKETKKGTKKKILQVLQKLAIHWDGPGPNANLIELDPYPFNHGKGVQ